MQYKNGNIFVSAKVKWLNRIAKIDVNKEFKYMIKNIYIMHSSNYNVNLYKKNNVEINRKHSGNRYRLWNIKKKLKRLKIILNNFFFVYFVYCSQGWF